MTEHAWLTRCRIRTNVPPSALRELLAEHTASRSTAAHHLVWRLFGDSPERTRDFLWRETRPGEFYLLSHRRPNEEQLFFDVDEPKVFAPALKAGDRLEFAVRANATVSRTRRSTDDSGAVTRLRGKRGDVVMDALYRDGARGSERAPRRQALVEVAAHDWLARQGASHGFAIKPQPQVEDWEADSSGLRVMGYAVWRLPREGSQARMDLGVMDLEGSLTVTDPAPFTAMLLNGLGRAKAFGCGLMLVRRSRAV